MSSRSRTRGRSCRHEPGVEGMETRDLLTVMALHHAVLPRATRVVGHVVPLPSSTATPVPTPHEMVREAFEARFQGPYNTGPGRFTSDALLTHVNAGGTSNQFLHGNVLIQITTPRDPTQPVTGTAELFEKNVATTGTILVLDLTGTSPADPTRPPSHLNWTVNGNSSGFYTNAKGQGTLNLIYFPGGRRPQRSFQAGNAGSVFQGQIYTTGVGSLLQFS